jgi:hypothetical protein
MYITHSFQLTAAELAVMNKAAATSGAAEETREVSKDIAISAQMVPLNTDWKNMSPAAAAALQTKLRISIGDTDVPTAAPTSLWNDMDISLRNLKNGLSALNKRLRLIKHAHALQEEEIEDSKEEKAEKEANQRARTYISASTCIHLKRGDRTPSTGAFTFDSTGQSFGMPAGLTTPTAGRFCPFKQHNAVEKGPGVVFAKKSTKNTLKVSPSGAGSKQDAQSHQSCSMPAQYASKCEKLGGCCVGLKCKAWVCGAKPASVVTLTPREQALAQFIKEVVLKKTLTPTMAPTGTIFPTTQPTHIQIDDEVEKFHEEAARRRKRMFASSKEALFRKYLQNARTVSYLQRDRMLTTNVPSSFPTSLPTLVPSPVPTILPTTLPTSLPTTCPTAAPVPTALPTLAPTREIVLRRHFEQKRKEAEQHVVLLKKQNQAEESKIQKLKKKLSKKLASSPLENEGYLSKLAKDPSTALGIEESQIKIDYRERSRIEKEISAWNVKTRANVSAEIEAVYRASRRTTQPTSTPTVAPTPLTLEFMEHEGKVQDKLLDAEFDAARSNSTASLLAKLRKQLKQAIRAQDLHNVAQQVLDIDEVKKNQETKTFTQDLNRAAMSLLRPLLLKEAPNTMLFAPTAVPTPHPSAPTSHPTRLPTMHAISAEPPHPMTPAPTPVLHGAPTPRDDDGGDDDNKDDDHHDIDSSVAAEAVAAYDSHHAVEAQEKKQKFSSATLALQRSGRIYSAKTLATTLPRKVAENGADPEDGYRR